MPPCARISSMTCSSGSPRTASTFTRTPSAPAREYTAARLGQSWEIDGPSRRLRLGCPTIHHRRSAADVQDAAKLGAELTIREAPQDERIVDHERDERT